MAIRRTPCDRSTKHSPFLLTFGQEMQAPIDVAIQPEETRPTSIQQYLDNLVTTMTEAEQLAQANCREAQDRYKAGHDKTAKVPKFRVGDQVLLHSPKVPQGQSTKLHRKWKGPYIIVEEGPNFTYKLHEENGRALRPLVNARRLVLFHDPENRYTPAVTPPEAQTRDPQGATHSTDTEHRTQSHPPVKSDATANPQRTPDDPDTWYQVHKVLDRRRRNGQTYYRIQCSATRLALGSPKQIFLQL